MPRKLTWREEQRQRDLQDSSRAVAPLKPAADSVLLDTSELSLEQVIDRVVEAVERAPAKRASAH
jgi:cytidylate kinase